MEAIKEFRRAVDEAATAAWLSGTGAPGAGPGQQALDRVLGEMLSGGAARGMRQRQTAPRNILPRLRGLLLRTASGISYLRRVT